jgi:hypothetical protein
MTSHFTFFSTKKATTGSSNEKYSRTGEEETRCDGGEGWRCCCDGDCAGCGSGRAGRREGCGGQTARASEREGAETTALSTRGLSAPPRVVACISHSSSPSPPPPPRFSCFSSSRAASLASRPPPRKCPTPSSRRAKVGTSLRYGVAVGGVLCFDADKNESEVKKFSRAFRFFSFLFVERALNAGAKGGCGVNARVAVCFRWRWRT